MCVNLTSDPPLPLPGSLPPFLGTPSSLWGAFRGWNRASPCEDSIGARTEGRGGLRIASNVRYQHAEACCTCSSCRFRSLILTKQALPNSSQQLKVIDDIKNLDSHVVRVGGVVSGLSERACPSSPKEHQRKDSGSGWVVKGTIRRGR